MSQAEFARRVGMSRQAISSILKGRGTYWQRAEQWADVLQLDGSDREEFLDAFAVACSPQRVQAIIDRLSVQAQKAEIVDRWIERVAERDDHYRP